MRNLGNVSKTMYSEYCQKWMLTAKNIINEHEKCFQKYKKLDKHAHAESYLHKKRMKVYQCTRKMYLFINRTKLQHFSFQPRLLKFWRTVTKKRDELIREIDEQLCKVYDDRERNYLLLFRRTLEKYDSSYGIQIGLILHRKFNKDIALEINEYLM